MSITYWIILLIIYSILRWTFFRGRSRNNIFWNHIDIWEVNSFRETYSLQHEFLVHKINFKPVLSSTGYCTGLLTTEGWLIIVCIFPLKYPIHFLNICRCLWVLRATIAHLSGTKIRPQDLPIINPRMIHAKFSKQPQNTINAQTPKNSTLTLNYLDQTWKHDSWHYCPTIRQTIGTTGFESYSLILKSMGK